MDYNRRQLYPHLHDPGNLYSFAFAQISQPVTKVLTSNRVYILGKPFHYLQVIINITTTTIIWTGYSGESSTFEIII